MTRETVGKVNAVARECGFEFEWTIQDFFRLSSEKCYESPEFLFNNKFWYLLAYPNEKFESSSVGYISVYLVCISFDHPITVTYSLGVKNVNGDIIERKVSTDTFKDCIAYGTPEFLSRSQLWKKKSELMPSDELTIICTLLHSNYDYEDEIVTEERFSSSDREDLSFQENTCFDKSVVCPLCNDILEVKKWLEHECKKAEITDESETGNCYYCKKFFLWEDIDLHEDMCMEVTEWINGQELTAKLTDDITTKCSPIKRSFGAKDNLSHKDACSENLLRCPLCKDDVEARKWLDHECHMARSSVDTETIECRSCKRSFHYDDISLHENVCFHVKERINRECHTAKLTNGTTTTKSSHSKKSFVVKDNSFRDGTCFEKFFECRLCNDSVDVRKWYNHECCTAKLADEISRDKCFYCKKVFLWEDVWLHENTCYEVTEWIGRERQTARLADDTAKTKRSCSKRSLKAEDNASHKKCCNKRVRCPVCNESIKVRKWPDHKCQMAVQFTDGPSTSGSTIISPKNSILSDLRELYLKKKDCDLTLTVKGQNFLAHKTILKARSPVFASIFRGDFIEKANGIVEIEDCDPSCFSDFLCFLYCGDEKSISKENVLGLFATATKFDVQDLKANCMEFLKGNLSIDTFYDTTTFALRNSEIGLVELTTQFFLKNAFKIILNNKWHSFLKENPLHCNELLMKYLVLIMQFRANNP